MGGLIAELNRQMKKAAREQARVQREQERAAEAAARDAERARKAEERAANQLVRAHMAERKRLEKEAKEAHIEAMLAQAEQQNAELADQYQELDSLLEATLDVDDYVDLDSLRREFSSSAMSASDSGEAVPPPPPIEDDPEPVLELPPEPRGLSKLFGRSSYERAVEEARGEHAEAMRRWREHIADNNHKREQLAKEHAERQRDLEAEIVEHNRQIEELKTNLAYGVEGAVQEYIDIVLSNSIYPDWFPIRHRFEFRAESAELKLTTLIPGPDKLPTTKEFKYQKSADEIVSKELTAKACRDRYLSIVEQVALRSLHEVFEADRRGVIKSIALEVGTETIDPATGRETYIPFVAVGAEREAFLELDLSRVVPAATLSHLGAAVSKKPYELLPADTSGVRRS